MVVGSAGMTASGQLTPTFAVTASRTGSISVVAELARIGDFQSPQQDDVDAHAFLLDAGVRFRERQERRAQVFGEAVLGGFSATVTGTGQQPYYPAGMDLTRATIPYKGDSRVPLWNELSSPKFFWGLGAGIQVHSDRAVFEVRTQVDYVMGLSTAQIVFVRTLAGAGFRF